MKENSNNQEIIYSWETTPEIEKQIAFKTLPVLVFCLFSLLLLAFFGINLVDSSEPLQITSFVNIIKKSLANDYNDPLSSFVNILLIFIFIVGFVYIIHIIFVIVRSFKSKFNMVFIITKGGLKVIDHANKSKFYDWNTLKSFTHTEMYNVHIFNVYRKLVFPLNYLFPVKIRSMEAQNAAVVMYLRRFILNDEKTNINKKWLNFIIICVVAGALLGLVYGILRK